MYFLTRTKIGRDHEKGFLTRFGKGSQIAASSELWAVILGIVLLYSKHTRRRPLFAHKLWSTNAHNAQRTPVSSVR